MESGEKIESTKSTNEAMKKTSESKLLDALFPEGTRKPDDDQMAAIQKIDNAVVSAGAGSGKTEVLATRFAYLLMTHPDIRVKNILALTFTKKAAAEIYARVFKKLNEFYGRLSDSRHGGFFLGEGKPATLLKRAIDELSDAKIQTLDAYSGDIVRLAATQYGIRPDFTIGTGTNSGDALQFVLRYKDCTEFSTAYQSFCKVGGIENFAKNYFSAPIEKYTSIATEKGFFTNHLKQQAEEIVNAWNKALFGKDSDDENSAEKMWGKLKLHFSLWQEEIESKKNAKPSVFFDNVKSAFMNFTENPSFTKIESVSTLFDKKTRGTIIPQLKECTDFLNRFSKVKLPGGKMTNENVIAIKECISLFRPAKAASLCLAFVLQSCVDFIENFEAISEMYELMDLYLEEANNAKRTSGVLSFKDVSDLALKILLENKTVRNQQKRQIKKIMIDEFQDNNSKNRDMLYLIAEKDDVFTEFKTSAEPSEELGSPSAPCDVPSDTSNDESNDSPRTASDTANNDSNEKSTKDWTSAASSAYETFLEALKKNLSPEKLFFVGDEKQSIYKFRGADVSVFNGLKTSLKGTSGSVNDAQLSMTNNYRSDVALLKSFNVLFGDDKKKVADDEKKTLPSLFYYDNYLKIPEYEATYLFNEDKRKSNFATKPNTTGIDSVAPFSLDENSVRLHACILNSGAHADKSKFFDYKKKNICLSEEETTGYYIAKTISDMHKQGKRFSEFAILDNSRTHRKDIQKFLRRFSIPYSIDVQKNIFSEGIANDFYNFLRICVYPTDTNAFAAFLTSPFVGMSEKGAMSVLSVMYKKNPTKNDEKNTDDDERVSNPSFSAFSKEFAASLFHLSAEDEKKYQKGAQLYFTEQKSILSSSITKTIENLWYSLGYFFETEINENVKMYAEQFDLLYQIALSAETADKDMAWFVDQLALTKQKEATFFKSEDAELDTEDVHYPLERRDAVTIMTIHQSKGLEFGTVFVTGVFSNPRGENQGDVFFDETTGLSIRPSDGGKNYFFLKQIEESKKKELAEQKRRIYVAITRAKHEAFLVGDVAKPAKDSKDFNPSIMHKILRYYYDSDKGIYQDNNYDFENYDEESPISDMPYYNKTEDAPFDFIKIHPLPYSFLTRERDDSKEKAGAKQKFLENLETHFSGRPIEDVENPNLPPNPSISPSLLEKPPHYMMAEDMLSKDGLSKNVSNEKAPLLQNPVFNALDKFITQFSAGDEEKETAESAFALPFTKANFGTLAHSYLEHWVKNGTVEHVEDSEHFDEKLRRILNENFGFGDARKTLKNICRLMVENFSVSIWGKSVLKAKKAHRLVKTEHRFKMTVGKACVTGSIDLFFENEDGTFTIIDYKTDNTEKDGALHPEKYIEQQACYRLALSKLYGINRGNIKTVLYFLRFDKSVDITELSNMTETALEERIKLVEKQN